jgi:uncharacterized protein YegL
MREADYDSNATLHVGLLLDESGSMAGTEAAVVGGVNEFVEKLRADEAGAETKVVATLGVFDRHAHDPVVRYAYAGIPLEEVTTFETGDYRPRGATPLNDAVVGVIRKIASDIRGKGDRVILVVLTDGFENASETPSRVVRKLIAEKEAEGWEFIYLGANQDAWADSGQIPVAPRGRKFDFDASPQGAAAALRHSASRVRDFRVDPAAYRESLKDQGDSILPDGGVERRRKD